MTRPSMSCGHTAQGVRRLPDGSTEPVCVVCHDSTVSDSAPDLRGRLMQCSYTRGRNGHPCASRLRPIPSDTQEAFFKHLPSEPMDQFYCGCWGWD